MATSSSLDDRSDSKSSKPSVSSMLTTLVLWLTKLLSVISRRLELTDAVCSNYGKKQNHYSYILLTIYGYLQNGLPLIRWYSIFQDSLILNFAIVKQKRYRTLSQYSQKPHPEIAYRIDVVQKTAFCFG